MQAEEQKGPRESEGDAGESNNTSQSGSHSSDDDDSAYYRSEESEDLNDTSNNRAAAKRRKEAANQVFKIANFPEEETGLVAKDSWPPVQMAFGTEHAAAIGQDGLLYTWGLN